MLILGIETATCQVGCAIGGHEGVIAEFHTARGRRHAETLTPAIEFGTVGNAYPSARALVELAHPKALREEFVQPSELAPLYLRKADAEINWDARPSNVAQVWSA